MHARNQTRCCFARPIQQQATAFAWQLVQSYRHSQPRCGQKKKPNKRILRTHACTNANAHMRTKHKQHTHTITHIWTHAHYYTHMNTRTLLHTYEHTHTTTHIWTHTLTYYYSIQNLSLLWRQRKYINAASFRRLHEKVHAQCHAMLWKRSE